MMPANNDSIDDNGQFILKCPVPKTDTAIGQKQNNLNTQAPSVVGGNTLYPIDTHPAVRKAHVF